MYADRHTRGMTLNPGSLGLSAGLVGLMMAGLIYSVPDFVRKTDTIFTAENIPLPPTPPEEPAKPKPAPRVIPRTVDTVTPDIPKQIVTIDPTPSVRFDSGTRPGPDLAEGTTGGTGIVAPVKPTPVEIGPQIDRRYAGYFQPLYPSDERRLGREGRVVVRVRIGVDGRVIQVEKVSAASESFFEATRRQALAKWRFKPATRDGIPVEAWREMAVSFVMTDS